MAKKRITITTYRVNNYVVQYRFFLNGCLFLGMAEHGIFNVKYYPA